MANEITIPILPCRSINEVLTFYRALGFEVTYQQEKPNNYACVQRGSIDLHFFSMKEYDPAQSYSSCIVLVPDVEALRQTFVDGLRQYYGKLPAAGIPRITPLRDKSDGGRGFNVIDPGGNWIRISQKVEALKTESEAPKTSTRLAKVIEAAELLADSKGDYAAAAKLLDTALTRNEAVPPVQRVQAIIARAALAITMGDRTLAANLLNEVRQIPLETDDHRALSAEWERANDLEQMLH
ncbi:MAG: VOC family protein [Anaerolineae bacterium]|nr:VOC family protein [Anaerolineae bacterium]